MNADGTAFWQPPYMDSLESVEVQFATDLFQWGQPDPTVYTTWATLKKPGQEGGLTFSFDPFGGPTYEDFGSIHKDQNNKMMLPPGNYYVFVHAYYGPPQYGELRWRSAYKVTVTYNNGTCREPYTGKQQPCQLFELRMGSDTWPPVLPTCQGPTVSGLITTIPVYAVYGCR